MNSTGEGTLGRIAQVKSSIENCTVDTHVTIVRPKPGIPIHYFGMAVMAWEPQLSTMGRGATNQTELSPSTIGESKITLPFKTLMDQFELFAEFIFQQVTNLVIQNDNPRFARDLLLPRLMSGGLPYESELNHGLYRHQQRRPVGQSTFTEHLEHELGWNSVYAWNNEIFGPHGTFGRTDTRDAVLIRDLRAALGRLNPQLPEPAIIDAVQKLIRHDFTRTLFQHNQDFYRFIRDGVPVTYRDGQGMLREVRARVIDFQNGKDVDGIAEQSFPCRSGTEVDGSADAGLQPPGRSDLLRQRAAPAFIQLKAVYKNICAGFDGNLRDYLDENVIAHAFHHNAFLIVK